MFLALAGIIGLISLVPIGIFLVGYILGIAIRDEEPKDPKDC